MAQNAKRAEERIEEMRRRVREMERGGDLDSLLNYECKEVARLLREEMLAERERHTASDEAAFPPSGVPALRKRPDR
jgi:predicted metal-dependent hydrolase